ncbi:probable phytol kinase 2, chloroplastic isoform X2 [Cryptomeria japonica]|uniref:probable phytol kinase 2, chloroplastic isoform X2 n=1 Tax=Cryptomeria japonica TaxID=3369 RepID=UPI0025AD57F8|nr:probable phytol kinase 2, chloroplastic isoform X2 [Cryptomeria japonica]
MGASQVGCSPSGRRETCSVKPENFMTFARFSIPMFSPQDQIVHDIIVSALTASIVLVCLRFWDEMAKRNVFDQKLNRKFVHINIGLVFMLCWPLFSNGPQAPYLAALAPGVNIFRMIGLGFGILKNEAMVKSMSRYGDARELLKGPLYYACSLTFITILFWRTSPTAPVAMATLCAGDGVADIAGRRLGTIKLPYNRNKSFAGSFAMLIMGFTVSVGYLFYFASFGYYEVSLQMIMLTLFISIAATIIESLPISTDIDDNLTVSLISALVGFLVF